MQSPSTTKDIDSILRPSSTWKTPCQQKSVLILPNGLSKLGEQAHGRNLISTMGEFEPNLNKKYGKFSARPVNTHSYILIMQRTFCFQVLAHRVHSRCLRVSALYKFTFTFTLHYDKNGCVLQRLIRLVFVLIGLFKSIKQ